MVASHIKLKGSTNAATWKKKVYPQNTPLTPTPPPPPVKTSKFNFFKTVVNQIKENHVHVCSNMSQYLLAVLPRPWWAGSIGQLFWNIVMLHIKINRITNAAPLYQIFCLQTPPHDPWGGNVKIQLCFQNMVTLHIKLNRFTNAATW